jgi:hypothetical protein
MMRFIDLRIGVQPWIVHDAINKIIDDGGDGIDAPEPVIERFLSWHCLTVGLIHHTSHSFQALFQYNIEGKNAPTGS